MNKFIFTIKWKKEFDKIDNLSKDRVIKKIKIFKN